MVAASSSEILLPINQTKRRHIRGKPISASERLWEP